jgi:ABC-type transport system involved in cytochrome c biogenesis permease subunit
MAKVITHTAERSRHSTASWLLLAVNVACATVLAISVPHLITAGGWFSGARSGEKFLYVALIAYLGASILYGASLALRQAELLAGAVLLSRGGLMLHTIAIVARWASSGHAPLSDIYEMVLVFSWAVVAIHAVVEWRLKLPFLGAITLPIAALALILMQVLPGEIRPLVPALQSTWLQVHVTLAMLSYAGFTISFAIALLFLIKDGVTSRTFLSGCAALVVAVYGTVATTSVNGSMALTMAAWDPSTREKVMVAPHKALMVPLASLGWPFVIALGLAIATLAMSLTAAYSARPESWDRGVRWTFLGALGAQALALILLLVKVNSGPQYLAEYPQGFAVRLVDSPFLLAGVVTALFASIAWKVLDWRYDSIVGYLPDRDTLDSLIYKTVAISFPLLTFMIIAGAYWANRTWGTYWSWDPKEDWALITWLTYAGYIHMRLTRGWRGRRSAYFAIIGFGIVMFTFFGVTYLLPGLHSYA